MREAHGLAAQLLRPILDTYRGSAVAVVGCHARGMERPSCELDVVIVTNERRLNSTVRMGEVFLDLFFVSERDILKPPSPEHAVSLAQASTIRDISMIMSTSVASNLAVLNSSAQRSSRHRLTSALKSLSRAEETLSKGSMVDTGFWLLAAAYDYVYSWLYSREIQPSPSHLLGQLRSQSGATSKSFDSFSRGAGLEDSSRANCASRLGGLAVLYDVLRGGHAGTKAVRSAWSTTRHECVSSKARELNERIELAECYSYLGMEMLNALRQLTEREEGVFKAGMGLSALTTGDDRLLGDRLMRDLGMWRERDSLREAIELLRDQVSSLARKT